MNGTVRLLAAALGTIAGGYALACVGMWWVQETLLFHPPPQTRADLDALAATEGIEPFTIEAEDGITLYGWHAPGAGEHALLFFHGNGGRLESVQWLAAALDGVDVFGISYRGYPGSEGLPSEAGMARDARALWNHVTQDRGIPPERIVVQGLSMGGGVAHHLLTEAKPAGAVFDSTFLSIEQLASDRFGFLPVSRLLRHPFRSIDRAPGIGIPSLVLHGDADSLIPVAHGRALAKLHPNATYIEIRNQDHNDWSLLDPVARDAWYRFLTQVWNLP